MTRSIRLLLLAAALVAPAAAGSPGGGPALRVASTTTVGGSPSSLTMAAGDVWVSLGLDGVARLDRETGSVVARVEPGGAVIGLAAGFGAVWAIDVFGDRLLRIDPETNTVTNEIPVGGLPNGVAVGHGSVWVQNQFDSTVSRVDPTTGRVTSTILFYPGELWPGGILSTPTGVWVVTAGGNAVSRIVPATSSVRKEIRVLGARSLAFAGGALWVGRAHATSLVRIEAGRIEDVAVAGLRTEGYGPRLAGGAELWLARTGTVVQVRPHVGRPLRLPQLRHASAVIVAADHIWVADQTAGRVLRFRNGRSQ